MEKLLLLSLFLLASGANAAIINYTWGGNGDSYQSTLSAPDLFWPATGQFSFDTESRAMISASVQSDPVSFTWEGVSPVNVQADYQIDGGNNRAILDFSEVISGFGLFLYFENFSYPTGDDPFYYLDRAWLYEGAAIDTGDVYYTMCCRMRLDSIVEVPEPATLSLLALGLAAIGIRRRLRYS